MTFMTIGVIVLALLVAFAWWGSKPYRHRGIAPSALGRYFEALLLRGEIGGQMFVRIEPHSSAILPFIKYGTEEAGGIRLALPLTPGSEEFFESVTNVITMSGFPIRIAEPTKEEPRRFAVVNFGRDVGEAVRLVGVARRARSAAGDGVDLWFRGLRVGWRPSSTVGNVQKD